ncbi:glycosyltransferase family 4 protein [Bacteroides xylanisolvens]|jgi:glycosyltransferase EpsD|uniref:glycosyltransferase family 4 protein n=1 Tax=Bacteroides xylanisolvens TaxID=371601 RepID=UPI0039B62A85
MKKILFVANIHKHFLAFHLPYMQWFKNQGYKVHVVAGGDADVVVPIADKQFTLPIERSPFKVSNIRACSKLSSIIKREQYCLVLCHTAMGAVVARWAARKVRSKGCLKVLYTAHGFHFFKGSPKRYWWMYYPMEKFLSRYTDAIITINQEDFNLVKTHGFHNKDTYKIPGIGINTKRLLSTSLELRHRLRQEYGYEDSNLILIYIAEYIERKNHLFIIDTLPQLSKRIPNIKVLFAGRGCLMEQMKEYARVIHVERYIDFLGYRKDIGQLIALSDIGISASRQEGLGLNIAEEMYSGIPVVVSEDRGHKELVVNGENGFIYPQMDQEAFINSIVKMGKDEELRKQMGEDAKMKMKKFALDNALEEMVKIYQKYL